MNASPSWGVVATIKAPSRDILNFAAHHLDLGATQVHVYLDTPAPEAEAALRAHPNCRVVLCDDTYWQRRRRNGRPAAHQPRQSVNATHCLRRRAQVDWLAHIDVDEFLWPASPLPAQLATLPADALSARIRPIEALASDTDDPPPTGTLWFKSCSRLKGRRREETEAIYPDYGAHLNGGFLSHVAGKIFVRTGLPDTSLRIHNAFRGKEADMDPPELSATRLCHLHGDTWEIWYNSYRYRMDHGSYRVGLKPASEGDGGLNMHALFQAIEAEGGAAALRDFYTRVCTATPDLRARLAEFGHLHAIALDLDSKRARHFPNYV